MNDMENTILSYNHILAFSLKQTMVNVNDLLYNLQNMKQLQMNLDMVQDLKNKTQMSLNMMSLTYLRKYLLDIPTGPILFFNLIRRFYPLSDEQIVKYENQKAEDYKITNLTVFRRKGYGFVLDDKSYCVNARSKNSHEISSDLLREIERVDMQFQLCGDSDLYRYNYKIDFHNDEKIGYSPSSGGCYRNALMENTFTLWDWELVGEIARRAYENSGYDRGLSLLLDNRGFIAQMGVDDVENTILNLQELSGGKIFEGTIKATIEKYKTIDRYSLYSYLPISKEFIVEHQNRMDWSILQLNPRIQWDWELMNLCLLKYKETMSELDWLQLIGSHAMYSFIEPFLNDELLLDIEKLYGFTTVRNSLE